jgi:uncharacterized protein YjbI with pentapeptide repeats
MFYMKRSQERVIAAIGLVVLAEAALFGLPWRLMLDVLTRTSLAVLAVIVATLLLATAAIRAGFREIRSGRVRWFWTALLILVPVIALTAIGLFVLIKVVPVAPQDSAVRVELIKTALAIGAGTGGVVALVLSGRRGWSTEHDATERRITELYTKAVEQLGSDKAPVRLGGLYALERLAQASPELRQTIVDVICAYLRMPYTAPRPGVQRQLGLPRSVRPGRRSTNKRQSDPATSGNIVSIDKTGEEREVRLAAQRILEDHLRPEIQQTEGRSMSARRGTVEQRFWPHMDIDLTAATLIDFSLKNCRVHNARFSQAQFIGDARFDRAKFSGDAGFELAQFSGDAGFELAQFSRDAQFVDTRFVGDAEFSRAIFSGGRTYFFGARFGRKAWFCWAQFGLRHNFSEAHFSLAQFDGDARFDWAEFSGIAGFIRTQFSGNARFRGTQFGTAEQFGFANFREAKFGGNVEFSEARAPWSKPHEWPPAVQLREDQDNPGWGILERISR